MRKLYFLIIPVFIIFYITLTNCYAQEPFVYMVDGKFKLGCDNYYPMAMAYTVNVIRDTNNQYNISPYGSFCNYEPQCFIPYTNGFTCGCDVEDWHNAIKSHLDTISSMGFNLIRLNGMAVGVRTSGITDAEREFISAPVYQQTPEDPCCQNYITYLNDTADIYPVHAAALEEFIGLVREHNTLHPERQLRVVVLGGIDGLSLFSKKYERYLSYMGKHFKNEPLIFSWEIATEGWYMKFFEGEINNKYKRVNDFGRWYYALKDESPLQFITYGAKPQDVFNWDPNAMPLDYVNLHHYPDKSELYSDTIIQKYSAVVKWFSESVNKPWIIGEANIAGNDSVNERHPEIVTEAQQKEFNEEILKYSRWYGAEGFTSWKYKETNWSDTSSTVFSKAEDCYGFVYRNDDDQTTKMVASAIRNFNPYANIQGCSHPSYELMYNLDGQDDLAVSGIVYDEDSIPVKNAYIKATGSISDTIWKGFSTFSDSLGNYNLYRDSTYSITYLVVSAMGRQVVESDVNITPGNTATIDFCIHKLNPDSIPPPIVLQDTLIIQTGDTVLWDKLASVHETHIRIDSGALLTVTDTAWLKPNAKIIVMPGGRMVVNGGMLIGFCTWDGIEVWGNPENIQVPAAQGWLSISNGGTVENALTGVRVGSEDFINKGGGMVSATEAVFRNNRTCVLYHNYAGSNIGNFNLTVFETTKELMDGSTPDDLMKLISVENIKINGCTFRNTRDSAVAYSSRGKGITAIEASFYVDHQCISETTPCSAYQETVFDSLYYGVYAYNISSALAPSIKNSQFTKNYRGAYLSGITWAVVDSCSFETNADFNPTGGYGLYLDNCTGYTIEENNFYSTMQSPTSIGMIVHNSGTDPNEIYRNWFHNLEQGISAQEQNRDPRSILGQGLQIRCCTFDTCNFDILVPPPALAGRGIALHQGANSDSAIDMAGNLFDIHSQTPNNDYDDLNNQGSYFSYYYPFNYEFGFSNVMPVDYTTNSVTRYGVYVTPTWSFKNGCPETISGVGGISENELRSMVTEANLNVNITKQTLSALVDGGSTESLYLDVEGSYPPEALEIYNQLIGASPYLSDTVVGATIEKEGVIPGSMLRDVMVANPQSAKSEKLMAKLDDRYTPLPEYMKAQILQGRNLLGLKESLESQLAKYKLQKQRAFNKLIHYYMHHDVISGWRDSIASLLADDNQLRSKYQLALWQLQNGEIAQSGNTLSSIPTIFDLQGDELDVHNDMITFHSILSGIMNSDGSWPHVTPSQVQQLENLSQASSPASVYARNILLGPGNLVYDEPIQLPDMLKSAKAEQEYQNILNYKKPDVLELYPNPTADFFILGYQLNGTTTGASIEIRNTKGELIKTIAVSQTKEQHIVTTEYWMAGTYIATLVQKGKTLDSIKITLVK